jgi:hypothetical protein
MKPPSAPKELEDVTEPRAAVFAETTDEAALGAEGARMCLKAGECGDQPLNEAGDFRARPIFEIAEVDRETQHREVRVETGAAIDAALEELHRDLLLYRNLLRR